MKINEKNEQKLIAALNEFQKSYSKRIVTLDQIKKDISRAEQKLISLSLAKKDWDGCTLLLSPEQVPNSYRKIGKAFGTSVIITRIKRDWVLTNLMRVVCKSTAYGASNSSFLRLSENAKAKLKTTFVL